MYVKESPVFSLRIVVIVFSFLAFSNGALKLGSVLSVAVRHFNVDSTARIQLLKFLCRQRFGADELQLELLSGVLPIPTNETRNRGKPTRTHVNDTACKLGPPLLASIFTSWA